MVNITNLNARKLKSRDHMKLAADFIAQSKNGSKNGSSMCETLFTNSGYVFMNPTEALVMGDVVKEGDSTLSVLSSGDFCLDSIYHGAKNITLFDINKFQYYMAMLKIKGIQALGYDEFFSFFSDSASDLYVASKVYEKIKRMDKSNPEFAFWDHLMGIRRGEETYITNSPYFKYLKSLEATGGKKIGQFEFDELMKGIDPGYKSSQFFALLFGYDGAHTPASYLESRESYAATQERLTGAHIDFINCDLAQIRKKLLASGKKDGGFDSIYLSNIPEYIDGKEFLGNVNGALMPLLKEDGSIVYCCQGIEPEHLTTFTAGDIEVLRETIGGTQDSFSSDLSVVQKINDIEGYNALREMFDVSFTTADAYVGDDTSKKDIFVRVKAKK